MRLTEEWFEQRFEVIFILKIFFQRHRQRNEHIDLSACLKFIISCRTNCIPCRSHNKDRRNSTQGYVIDWFLFLCYINYVLISVKVYLKIVRSILDIKGVRVNFGQTPLNNYSHRLQHMRTWRFLAQFLFLVQQSRLNRVLIFIIKKPLMSTLNITLQLLHFSDK